MAGLTQAIEYYTEKYGLELDGSHRVYNIDLNVRPMGFERCQPYYLKLNDFEADTKTWQSTLKGLFIYLQSNWPKTKEELLNYKVDWSSAKQFDDHKFSANSMETIDGIWISHNHTGSLYIWCIQELIKFYNPPINEFKFRIHVPTLNEPEEVKRNFKLIVIENFKEYLKELGKTDKSIDVVLKNIEVCNKILNRINSAENDYYLIDDIKRYQQVKIKMVEKIRMNAWMKENQIEVVHTSLNYLYNFLKTF